MSLTMTMPLPSTGQNTCDTLSIVELLQVSGQKRERGQFKAAESLTRQALDCATSLSNPKWIARASGEMAILQYGFRQYGEALKLIAQCLPAAQSSGDEVLQANCLCYRAAIHLSQHQMTDVEQDLLAATHLFEKSQDQKGIVRTGYFLGTLYRNTGNYDQALSCYESALQTAIRAGYTFGIATSHGLMGTVYGARSNNEEAMLHFQAALVEWQKLDNQQGIADSYHMIGAVHFQRSDYAEALTNYLASLQIRSETGDSVKIAESYHDIGHIYYKQGQAREALSHYTTSLRIFESVGNKERIAKAHSSIGNACVDLNDFPEAIRHYEFAIATQKEISDKTGLSNSYTALASVYIRQNDLDRAEQLLIAANKNAQELGDNQYIARGSLQLSQLLLHYHKPDEARKEAENALEVGLQIGSKDVIVQSYRLLSEIEDSLGHYREALLAYKNYKRYEDSIWVADKEKLIDELKINYETEKKDHAIQRLASAHEIDLLKLNVQHELLEKIRLEKDRIRTENLYHLQQIALLDNEKKLQQLQLEKGKTEIAIQQVAAARAQDQLTVLHQQGALQNIQLKKQRVVRNFLMACILILGLLAFVAYHYFITRQKLKLQTLRNKIASDLHDDVGSTLSSIAMFSEMAQQQSKEVIPLLDTIGENSRKMLDAMADIVWTINPENDQFENIILRMRSYAYEILGAKQIDFDFTAADDVLHMKLPMDVRRNLFLIFKEATNNIVKYAHTDTALFSITNEKDRISMTIRDHGKGFDVRQLTEGNGLKNMKKRAAEIGGQLRIDSFPGQGTTILFQWSV